jgi:HEAT repeat protein
VEGDALAPEWDALYASASIKAFRDKELTRAYFTDALRAFHTELLSGADRDWPEGARPSDRLLIEGLAAESFLSRARSAVLAAQREDIPAWQKNAALLAVLREDGNKIVRWACLWALGRCGEGVAGAVEGVGEMSDDPFIRARARCAAAKIRKRDAGD